MKLSKMLLALTAVVMLGAAALVSSKARDEISEPRGAPTPVVLQVKGDAQVQKMIDAITAFLKELPDAQRKKAHLAYDDPMRLKWHYYPRVAWERSGALLKELDAKQKDAFFEVIKTGTSSTGYQTVRDMMRLEAILREIENTPLARVLRDPEKFYLTIFGNPAMTGRWAWKLEGHHLTLYYVIDAGKIVSSTPFVLGANPGRVPSGPDRGFRTLPRQEDLGRALFTALDAKSRSLATLFDEPPFDILTNADLKPKRLPKQGVRYRDMNETQRQVLDEMLEVYTGLQPESVQKKLLAEITAAGRDEIRFGWSGSAAPGESHYYQVNGPSFLIEFCNAQNAGNHIHLVWRDYVNDFGETGSLKK